jgi:hypothetical protein
LKLQDGFELIAKILYPMAQPTFFATASEAATITFLPVHGILMPEAYDYSAPVVNSVGTETILMGKALGSALHINGNTLKT